MLCQSWRSFRTTALACGRWHAGRCSVHGADGLSVLAYSTATVPRSGLGSRLARGTMSIQLYVLYIYLELDSTRQNLPWKHRLRPQLCLQLYELINVYQQPCKL